MVQVLKESVIFLLLDIFISKDPTADCQIEHIISSEIENVVGLYLVI